MSEEQIPYRSAGDFGFSKDPRHLESVQQWRDTAVRDGWSIEPTYQSEPVTRAAQLKREGYSILLLTRHPLEMNGKPHPKWHNESKISIWGPDGLAIKPPASYSWDAIVKASRVCSACKAEDVDTVRVGFAGRVCAACLPGQRKKIETPGWCD